MSGPRNSDKLFKVRELWIQYQGKEEHALVKVGVLSNLMFIVWECNGYKTKKQIEERVSADKCHRSVCKNVKKKITDENFLNSMLGFFFYSSLINSFSLYFTFQPQFLLPLFLLSPSPTHTLFLFPSSSSPVSFQKGKVSHGLKHSMAHQVEVEWVLPHA